MSERIFFNSSLPRSGSTLMQNILAQNPQVKAEYDELLRVAERVN